MPANTLDSIAEPIQLEHSYAISKAMRAGGDRSTHSTRRRALRSQS